MIIDSDVVNHVFTFKNFVHALSGASGGIVGLTVFYPLDTVRTRLQVDENLTGKFPPSVILHIFQNEGLSSLYRGWFPVVSSLCCSNFVYFYTYNLLKSYYNLEDNNIHAGKNLLLAFTAGVVNVLSTTPLWVVNTRLKLQGVRFLDEGTNDSHSKTSYKGIFDAFVKIIRLEGIGALWHGTVPSLILVTNPAIHFMIYESLKRYFQILTKSKELNPALYFICGAIAKTAATILTYPMQVIQTKLRSGRQKTDHYHRKSTLDILKEIIRLKGFLALFKGLEAKLLQTVLMAALMFLTYEEIAIFIFKIMGIKNEFKR